MAKYVRKLNRDDSGYHYEEVKSNVEENDPAGDYVKAKIRENSMLKNAIKEERKVREDAFTEAQKMIEDSFIPTRGGQVHNEAVRRIKKLAGVKGRDLDAAVVHFNPEKNIYTINDKKYTVECLSDMRAYHSVDILGEIKKDATGHDGIKSGSISVADIDDSSYFKTGSVDAEFGMIREPIAPHSRLIKE